MASELTTRDFVLFAYSAFGGVIRGKTTLQKRVYFLAVILKRDLGYGPHYYGPYSASVASANVELKSLGFISEIASPYGYDSRGFEMVRYDYRLTEEGLRLVGEKAERFSAEWDSIAKAAKGIEAAGDLNYMELSIAAKAYYILKLKGRATLDEISKMLPNFGWSVSPEELAKAANFLERMQLVHHA